MEGIEVIRPRSRESWLKRRRQTIGASEIGVLFGVDKYRTPFELYAVKRGEYEPRFAETDINEWSIRLPPTERGNVMEPVAMKLLRRLRPTWEVRTNAIPGGAVYVDAAARMSGTPDCFATIDGGERACIQIKSVAPHVFNAEWRDGDELAPPLGAQIQVNVEAPLSGCTRAFVGAIVLDYDLTLHLLEVRLRPALLAKAKAHVAEFWRRVEQNDPYPPDFARDQDVIAALYPDDDGPQIDLSGNERVAAILAEREALQVRKRDGDAADKARKALDAELIFAMGNAESARVAGGVTVTAKTVRRGDYAVEATSYRQVRVKAPKAIQAAAE